MNTKQRRFLGAALTLGCLVLPGTLHAGGGGLPVLSTTGGEVAIGGTFETSVTIENSMDSQGWSFTICHDPTVVSLEQFDNGAYTFVVNGGQPADFHQFEQTPSGWGVGVVISLLGLEFMPAGTFEIGRAVYSGVAEGSTTLCPCDGIGIPPVSTVIVYSGQSITPVFDCATLEVPPGPSSTAPFLVRGDANHDGMIDISDPIALLDSAFVTGQVLPCPGAADANGDSSWNLADAIHLLLFLFAGGAPPAAPYPACTEVPGALCPAGVTCP